MVSSGPKFLQVVIKEVVEAKQRETKFCPRLCKYVAEFTKNLLNVKNKNKKTIQFENFSIWHVGFFFHQTWWLTFLSQPASLYSRFNLLLKLWCHQTSVTAVPRRCCNQTYAKPNLCVWSTHRWRGRVFSSREQWAVSLLLTASLHACLERT